MNNLVLMVGAYADVDQRRNAEIKDCVKRNLSCGFFDKVVFFVENDLPAYLELTKAYKDKVEFVNICRRPLYSHFVNRGNNQYKNWVVVASNSDIFFDSSITLFKNKSVAGKLYAITRQDRCSTGYRLRMNPHKTQDVWVWQAPIQVKAEIELGRPGCENHFLWNAANSGLIVENPSLTIKVYHRHECGVRHYSQRDRVRGAYHHVKPCVLS